MIDIAVCFVLYAGFAVLFFKNHREIREEIERFTNNFPGGGGPGSPMHPSPANDSALLGHRKSSDDGKGTSVRVRPE